MKPGYSATGCVYLCYDAQGVLLYVGKAQDWKSRRNSHKVNSKWDWLKEHEWWPRVADTILIPLADPDDRTRVEKALIQVLDPPFNTMHTSRQTSDMRAAQARGVRHRMDYDCDCTMCERRKEKAS